MVQNIALELEVAPRVVGRYELIVPLGEGGMACVYLAVQRGPIANKLVVVKLLREQLTSDEQFVAMFTDESRIAALLNHPNVVHTYESSSSDSQYYIVMEFLEGKTLSQLLRSVGRQHFPLDAHLWVICEILAGLHYAHELADFGGTPLNIVHRDVSPSNILITTRGEIKLLDFGIAKAQGALAETQHGIVKGKLGYASPEQCFGRKADARADIYSVGVMLWEALAGKRRPMRDAALLVARSTSASSAIDSEVSESFANVPPGLVRIVRRATALDPADRFQTALDFELELRQFLSATSSDAALALQKLVVEHFGGELAAIRRAIDERVGQVRHSAPPDPRTVASEIRALAPQGAPPSFTVTQPRRSWGLGLTAAGFVVVGLAAAWFFRGTLRPPAASIVRAATLAVESPKLEAVAAALPQPSAPAPINSEPPETPAPVAEAPSATSPVHASHPFRPHPPWLRKLRSLSVSPKSAPLVSPLASAPMPRTAEPGVDLRQSPTVPTIRPLDERDPYAL